jgi:hypothetical protein
MFERLGCLNGVEVFPLKVFNERISKPPSGLFGHGRPSQSCLLTAANDVPLQ